MEHETVGVVAVILTFLGLASVVAAAILFLLGILALSIARVDALLPVEHHPLD